MKASQAIPLPQGSPKAGGEIVMEFSTDNSMPALCAGSGAPTCSAPKGSLYMRTDGSGTGDRLYVNTNGSTTWTAVTTAA